MNAIAKRPAEMRVLLERAGFRIRSATRADCAYCRGRSVSTVAFTNDVAFCHRCHWRANTITLAHKLGLLKSDPVTRARLRAEAQWRARREAPIRAFDLWRERCIRLVSDRYYMLSRKAVLAHRVLLLFPKWAPAWHALAAFYHAEARLSAAFDFLNFAKASAWLQADAKPADVFRLWRCKRVAAQQRTC